VTDRTPELEALEKLHAARQRIRAELSKVIVGQEQIIENLLLALFARGHCLLIGVPGLAKTLMIQTLAQSLGLAFNRIQFTPDLMPSDISGTEILVEEKGTGHKALQFVRGPVFANVVLADEINRTPPKTQAALLEAMQEGQVTAGGRRFVLDKPFFVLATQNPIEQEGTYPLPEAQLDRFMFSLNVDYPTEDEECAIVSRTTTPETATVANVVTAGELLAMQDLVRQVPIGDHVVRFAVRLARLTRPGRDGAASDAPQIVNDYVQWGAGPRAAQYLILGAKARALMEGQLCVATEDVCAVAAPVLRHRLITNFRAESEEVKPDDIVRQLVATIRQ
jgi:MoxR-like ATPase